MILSLFINYKMYTLIYLNGQFNKPDTLLPFLQSNIGCASLLQIDCITPFKGNEKNFIQDVCDHLNRIDSQIEVDNIVTKNASIESTLKGDYVKYMVIQVLVKEKA